MEGKGKRRRGKQTKIAKKEEESKIKKRQTSKRMKSIQELTTDLDTPRQRKAVKQGDKNDKGRKKKLFSSQ